MVHKPSKSAVTLLGAGTQGRRLAFMWSSCGQDVYLIDKQPNQLQESQRYIQKLQQDSKHADLRFGTIRTQSLDSLSYALRISWLVVECTPEKLPLKREIISQLDQEAPSDTIIASNSSSYSIGEIIDGLKLVNDRRILSAHSYWPPETNAIEIMGHKSTDHTCIAELMDRCREHGFRAFEVKRESTGYIYNRIWAAIKRESLLVAAENVATPAEIDDIFKEVLKTPKGPFEQMDVVGLDVVLDIEEHYAAERKDVPREPREFLKEMIKNGNLGVKSQKGFYTYGES